MDNVPILYFSLANGKAVCEGNFEQEELSIPSTYHYFKWWTPTVAFHSKR